MNKVILLGRLTKEPELKYTQTNNTPVCSFTLAVDRPVKKGEEKKADFVNCQAWKGTAEFVSKYFSKGQLVAVCGRLQSRSWDDTEGKKHYVTEVLTNEVHFAEKKRDSVPASPDGFYPIDNDDELPF